MWGAPSSGERVSGRAGGPSGEQLLAGVARGDHDAFEKFYDRMSAAVFGTVRRVVRDQAQSEEVTQEVFLEVWRTAPRFDASRGGASTWVMVMAHRRAIDRVRAAQSATDREVAAAIRDTDRPYDVVEDLVTKTLEYEEVREALDSLTPLQRQAVTLAYYDGRTQAEVAKLLGIPLGTVKTRIRDGLIRLRDAMGVSA
jgi:RNA polymerase sigma-70 factor (ECF subfamily)